MALRKVIHEGDTLLRKRSREIKEITDRIKALADDMWETMYNANGIGLAAPQIGVLRRMIVVDITECLAEEEEAGEGSEAGENAQADEDSMVETDEITEESRPEPIKYLMINPEIVEVSEETVTAKEGCLSVPGFLGVVVRPACVRVRALDIEGNTFEVEGEGMLAKALQHEIDHLNGILYTDIAESLEEIKPE